jgi:thiamine monophosphate kinase
LTVCFVVASASHRKQGLPSPRHALRQPVQQQWQCCLAGGDDYELCFTVPSDREISMRARMADLRTPVCRVGEVLAGSGVQWWRGGAQQTLSVKGYNHFAHKDQEQNLD